MKKSLLALLLAMLSFFMFAGISQAGDCIYLYSYKDSNYYYDSSDAKYEGDIVSFVFYGNNACEEDSDTLDAEIDCAGRMICYGTWGVWSEWQSIPPGSIMDVLAQKLCR